MAGSKEIKQRLRSIKNTQKTTKAMELVSSAKMRRAVASAQGTRQYYHLLHDIFVRLHGPMMRKNKEQFRRFFASYEESDTSHTTIVAFASNRGLCGSFNANIVKTVKTLTDSTPRHELIVVGKRLGMMLDESGVHFDRVYEKDDNARTNISTEDIALSLYDHFASATTDRVLIVYTNYRSPLVQEVAVAQLFPLLGESGIAQRMEEDLTPVPVEELIPRTKYIMEPTAYRILDYLIPRLVEVQLYQALLESNASEHSSRMIAMKNASDSAREMAQDLVLEFNKARQAHITQEIAEISAGMAAIV